MWLPCPTPAENKGVAEVAGEDWKGRMDDLYLLSRMATFVMGSSRDGVQK